MSNNLWMASTALMLSFAAPAFAQDTDAPVEAAEAGVEDQGITVIGSRGRARTDVDRPVPVDVVSTEDLAATGQTDLGQQVQFTSPSFNSSKYGVNGATNFADPASLRGLAPDIVALAGFMRILTEGLVREFEGRMLNIHPSLLPRHKGLHTHEAVLRDGDAEHGATVHFVTPQLDGGPLVIQGRFTVTAQDDVRQLAERVLEEIECRIYPQAVAWMARGELRCEQGVVRFRDRLLPAALSLDDLESAFR